MNTSINFKNSKFYFIAAGIFLMILLGIGLRYPAIVERKNSEVDFLQSEKWVHFPGAEIRNDKVHFLPLRRSIIHQDGSVGQSNPPIHFDQRLLIKGDFSVALTLEQIDKEASFRLYSAPPIVYDQWRYETPSINIKVSNNSLVVQIWDGTSSHSMDERTYNTFLPTPITISLEYVKNQFNINAGGRRLGSIPAHHIFDSGTIWFGIDGGTGSKGFVIGQLSARALNGGSVKLVSSSFDRVDQPDKNSLRNLIDARSKKIKMGTAVSVGPLLTDTNYRNIALNQFNIITPENSMKPQFIHPLPEVYDFSEADQLVDIAQKNNILVHGHVLVYDKSNPDWMTKSPEIQRQAIMIDHITKVVSHFKGKVAQWDVVNEPFSKKNALYKNGKSGLEPNIWFLAMGEEYIDLAFKTARTADPSAKLYLNDYGVENDGQHWDALLALVKRLQQRGVPIDGVGFESHIYGDGDYVNTEQLKKHMEILDSMGLKVRISEIDVTGDDPKEQINQYVNVLDVCLQAQNCTSYATWGITDRYGSTTRSDRYPLVYGTSLLWDKDFKSKPAYEALQNRLKQSF